MGMRNRAEGWQHAKRTGHENERLVTELVRTDKTTQQRLLRCAHLTGVSVVDVQYGGLCEEDVDCVLGGKTKSKTDMWLTLSNKKRLNVSIKKGKGGQVFLIGIDRFIAGFELQYKKKIPPRVKRALELYFGSAQDTAAIIQQYGSKNQALELRQHRLVADTLKAYDKRLADELIGWFNDNIRLLFDYCFARGLAKNESDWAQIVYYRNMVGENSFDTLIYLPDVQARIPKTVEYGTKNGGSTIRLPFGFVQWHSPRKVIPGSLQFHHSYSKVTAM